MPQQHDSLLRWWVSFENFEGTLLLGHQKVSRLIASYLQKRSMWSWSIPTKPMLHRRQELNFEAITANIYAEDLAADIELSDVGYLWHLPVVKR